MFSIRNVKIRPRLLGGFSIVCAILCAACAFALFQMTQIQANLLDLKDNWFPSTITIGDIHSQLGSVRRNSLSILLTQSQEDKDKELKNRAKIRAKLLQFIDKYDKLADDGKDRELFENDKTALTNYLTVDDDLVKKAVAPNADFAALRTLANTTTRDALFAADSALNNHLKFIAENNDQAGAHALATYRRALILTLVIVLLAIAVAFWIAHAITVSLTRPIERALKVAEAVGNGDLSVEQSDNHFDTETGQLNRALARMTQQLIDIVSNVRKSSEAVLTGVSEIAAGNENLSQRTEEQAAAVEQTVASVEHLTTIVQSNADNAKQGLTLAQSTSDLANRGGHVMNNVIETMTGISHQSNNVAAIISTIEGIAFQTNILALNAAVEAARAGNEGRGFAVVAQEVRTLAQRSATAAKEIKDLVTQSVTQVNSGSTLVTDAGSAIDEMVREFRHVSDLMQEITAASTEGHQGLLEVNKAIGEIDTVTQHNAALVEQATAAACNVQQEADRLRSMVATFRLP